MSIRVISQSTEERNLETVELFEKIKPFLDEGYIYSQAVSLVIGKNETFNRFQDAWYRDLVDYGESMGYAYDDYSGKQNSIRYKK